MPQEERGADATEVKFSVSELCPLFGGDVGDEFLLVTSPEVREHLAIDGKAGAVREYAWTGSTARSGLLRVFDELRSAGRRAAVLWIADNEYEHFSVEQIAGIKLGAISFHSSPFSAQSLRRVLSIVESTDFVAESRFEAELLPKLDEARRIQFVSERYGTQCVFEHHEAEHWFSLHGALDYGMQAVLPTGELAVLTDASGDFSTTRGFSINGEIVLKGQPIVHRGGESASLAETLAMYDRLATMRKHAVIARIENGFITELRSPESENPFLDQIENLVEEDERYRKVHEVGFGTNPCCRNLSQENDFYNERYPGIHFGLGLGGYTIFHNDLVCTELTVLLEMPDGQLVDFHEGVRRQ